MHFTYAGHCNGKPPTNTVYAEGGTPITELTVGGLADTDVPQIGKNATMPTLTLKESGLKISRVYWFCLNTRETKATIDFFNGNSLARTLFFWELKLFCHVVEIKVFYYFP